MYVLAASLFPGFLFCGSVTAPAGGQAIVQHRVTRLQKNRFRFWRLIGDLLFVHHQNIVLVIYFFTGRTGKRTSTTSYHPLSYQIGLSGKKAILAEVSSRFRNNVLTSQYCCLWTLPYSPSISICRYLTGFRRLGLQVRWGIWPWGCIDVYPQT